MTKAQPKSSAMGPAVRLEVPAWAIAVADELVEMHDIPAAQRDAVARLIAHHSKDLLAELLHKSGIGFS